MERVPYEVGIAALFPEPSEALRNALGGVQAELEAFASELAARRPAAGWRSSGLAVDTLRDNPGHLLGAFVEGGYVEGDGMTFSVELTSGDFYPNLGRDPSAYYVEAEVYVDSDAPIDIGQQLVHELPEAEYADADEAVAGLLRAVRELRALAATMDPTADAWRRAAPR